MLISLYFQGRRAGIYYYFILYRPPRPVKEQGHPLYVYFPKFHHMSSLLSVGVKTKKAQGYPSRKPFRESLCASFFLLRERLSVFSELFCFYNSILYGFCQVGKNYLGTPKKCKKSKKVLNFIAIYAIILYMRFIFERNDLL